MSCASYTTYAKYTADTENADRISAWKALNTQDPKLFEDDDGTFYVYSTDASIGNEHKRGLQVRTSKDLLTWEAHPEPVIVNWDTDMLYWLEQTPETATTSAPTVIKQNGKYYMFHGIAADGALSKWPTAWIGLAIADSPFGPFEPAHKYDPRTYKQSALVRYAWKSNDKPIQFIPNEKSRFQAYIGGEMKKMTVKSIRVNGGKNTLETPVELVKGDWTDLHGNSYTGVSGLTGDWNVEFRLRLDSIGDNDRDKWAFALYDEETGDGWYLRCDSHTSDATETGAAANMYGSDFGANVEYEPKDEKEASALYSDNMDLVVKAKYDWQKGSCSVQVKSNGSVIYTAKGTRFTTDKVFDTFNTSSFDTATTEGKKTESKDPQAYGFGCADPEFVTDLTTGKAIANGFGDYYMTYGSGKGGIALVTVDSETFKPTYIDKSGERHVLDAPLDTIEGAFGVRIAGGEGAEFEGAQIVYNSDTGYYYMFVSMGNPIYEYRVGVGRSKEIGGPYLDAGGRSMGEVDSTPGSKNFYHNVGAKIIGAHQFKDERGWRSPGGQSIIRTKDGRIMFANHTRTDFLPSDHSYLQIHEMFFTESAWPVLNQNEFDPETEVSSFFLTSRIPGDYDVVITKRSPNVKAGSSFEDTTSDDECSESDGWATQSERITLENDGTVSGAYTGEWTFYKNDDGPKNTMSIKVSLDGMGTFEGFALYATDFSRLDRTRRDTVTITSICTERDSKANGEYFFGNKRNYK